MTTTKKRADEATTELERAAAEATAAREAAEENRATAMEAMHAADAVVLNLRARLGQGDATVTPGELADAADEQARLELLAQAADRRLAEAQRAERHVAIEAMAEQLAASSPMEIVDAEVERATRALQRAVKGIADVVIKRNEVIAQGIRDAYGAGLVQGRVSPGTRVQVVEKAPSGLRHTPSRLEVDGEVHVPTQVESAVERALRGALSAAGIDIQVGGDR